MHWMEFSGVSLPVAMTQSRPLCRYFHAYRIDHILGFFRIWEIPGDCVTGLLGHFRPSIPATQASLEANGLWDIDRCGPPQLHRHDTSLDHELPRPQASSCDCDSHRHLLPAGQEAGPTTS